MNSSLGITDMSGKDYYVRFARVVNDYQIDSSDGDQAGDPFEIAQEFRSIAGECALTELRSGNIKAGKDWELEANYWSLFRQLIKFRYSDKHQQQSQVNCSTRAAYEKELLQNNNDFYELWIIMVWLQDNLQTVERPENLPTKKWNHTLLKQGLQSQDVDYPLRDSSVILDEKDREQDRVIFKYIFQLLLRGKIEEALNECELSGNLTLSMIICGLQEYVNPEIDFHLKNEFDFQQGIKKHSLWRRTVYGISQNSKLDLYERAIYSLLAGVSPSEEVMSICNWEELLIFFINQKLQTDIENEMIRAGFVTDEEIQLYIPSSTESLSSILNDLSNLKPEESSHPLRTLIASIILGTTDSIVHSSVLQLFDAIKNSEQENEIFNEPYLLRVMTHTAIMFKIIDRHALNETDTSKLITSYITILKFYELFDCIPAYMTLLSAEETIEAYSFVLSTIEESSEKRKQIELMSVLHLPCSEIIKKITQRVFDDTEQQYQPTQVMSVCFETTKIDLHLINSVEWLLEGKLYVDAMNSILALARRFLLNGKVKSLELFFERNDLTTVINQIEIAIAVGKQPIYSSTRKELSQYENLIQGFVEYENWQKSVNQLNSESNIPSLIEKFQGFSNDINILIKDFLVELCEDEKSENTAILYEIRALYIPYLIIELHKKLVEASELLKIPKFISRALELTNFVANESERIYVLFQESGKLKEYLDLVAKTAILAEDIK